MLKQKINVSERFAIQALRSTGYSKLSAIDELIDNSKDASASMINISYNKETTELCIIDDGIGMSYEELQNAMNLGCDKSKYEKTQSGFFGTGMKSSILNLIDFDSDGSVVTIETQNGLGKNIVTWKPTESPFDYQIKKSKGSAHKHGTIITINKTTCGRNIESSLKKHIGTIYYPVLNYIKIFVSGEEIIAEDPLYRDNSLVIKNSEATIDNGNGLEIGVNITGVLLDNSVEKHKWDSRTKNSDDDIDDEDSSSSFGLVKSGFYLVYGNRYIEFGNNWKLINRTPHPALNRIRIEFAIHKDFTELFTVKFNKTAGLDRFDKNPKLKDLVIKLDSMVKDLLREDQGKSHATKNEKDGLKTINTAINIAGKKNGVKPIDKGRDPYTPEKTHNYPPERNPKTSTEREFWRIETEFISDSFQFWRLSYEGKKTIITLNENHPFYKNIWQPLSDKQGIGFMLASLAQAKNAYQFEKCIDNDGVEMNSETFWGDYWGEFGRTINKFLK